MPARKDRVMNKIICLLTVVVPLGFGAMPVMAEPGDLLQTLLNPGVSIAQVERNQWVRCPLAVVGENLAVGFPWDDTFGIDTGIAYLFDTSTGNVLRTFKSPHPAEGGNFGCAMAAVGNRLLIGAYRESREGRPKLAGAAYVFDASTGKLLHELQKPALAEGDRFGHPAAVLGGNFVVSCRWDDAGARDAGAVFLYDGSSGELLQAFRRPQPVDTKGPNAGAAYLFEGATGRLLHTFHNPEPGGKNGFAHAVAALGSNLLIADKSFFPSRAHGGVVYLVDSSTGDVLRTFSNPAPAINDGFGQAVATVGEHVLISANHANANGFNVGAAYLFDGSSGKLLHTFLNPTPAWNDHFGTTVASVGNKVVITAPFDDAAALDAGAVYLFEGGSSADFQSEEPPVTTRKTPTTRLYVRTAPPGAKVLVDELPVGTSPGLFFVWPGDHKVTVELKGYKAQSQPVKIVEGQITRVEAVLKR
jgi:outer membrane protein assembly factor BamB